MDVAHVVLLVLHIGGVVALLAGILVQVRRPDKKVNGLMRDGVGTAFVAGLFLVGVWRPATTRSTTPRSR